MGNLFSNERNDECFIRCSSGARKNTDQPVPDFDGKSLDWTICKTKIKASLRTANAMQIIESPEEQNNPELSDDRLYVFGLFQSTCARVVTRHLVNNNEMNADPFPV